MDCLSRHVCRQTLDINAGSGTGFWWRWYWNLPTTRNRSHACGWHSLRRRGWNPTTCTYRGRTRISGKWAGRPYLCPCCVRSATSKTWPGALVVRKLYGERLPLKVESRHCTDRSLCLLHARVYDEPIPLLRITDSGDNAAIWLKQLPKGCFVDCWWQ